jgi:hypothetical protein
MTATTTGQVELRDKGKGVGKSVLLYLAEFHERHFATSCGCRSMSLAQKQDFVYGLVP